MIFTVERDAHVFDHISADKYSNAHVNDIDCHEYAPVELKEFASMWKKALDKARKTRSLEPVLRYMTDDVLYSWCLPGVDPTYFGKTMEAKGKNAVAAVDPDIMLGVEGWEYPWIETYIDARKGSIFIRWEEVTPYTKKDGSRFKNGTFAVTRLDYAGGYKVSAVEDLVDCEFHIALVDEVIAAGFAPADLIRKQNAYYRQLAKDYNAFYRHLEDLCVKAGNDTAMIPDLLDGYYSPYRNAVVKTIDTELENVDAYNPDGSCGNGAGKAAASVVTTESHPEPEASKPAPEVVPVKSQLRKDDEAVRAEHMTIRNHVGYYDFTHKLLEVTGLDARSFLSRMFVAGIAKAKVGFAKYTTMLNEKAEIIDDVIVFRMEEDKYWVSTLYIEELMAWFGAHKTVEDVSWREITQITTMYAVQGPASRAVLNAILAEDISGLKQFQICDNRIGKVPVKIARSGYTGELGYEVYLSPENSEMLEAKLEEAGKPYGIKKITTDVIVTSLPREKGYVLMSDIGGLTPLDCGFGWSVDWSKQFIGKEALTAVRNTGAKKALLGFLVNDDAAEIEPGAEVLVNQQVAGRVTMFTYGYTIGKNFGFAVIDTDKGSVGERALIISGGRSYQAMLADRVFYDPNNDRTKEQNIPGLAQAAVNRSI